MVSLDINLSGTLNSSIITAEENTSVETSPNESNMDAVEQNKSETESNAYEESEPEDEADEANADKKLKNATYGHSFEIDISSVFPGKRRLKHVILDVKKLMKNASYIALLPDLSITNSKVLMKKKILTIT